MAFSFDTAVSNLDKVQNAIFGEDVLVDGKPYRGILDEVYDQFEGVESVFRTIKFQISDFPSGSMDEGTTIKMVSNGKEFTSYNAEPISGELVVELR